MYRFFSPRHCLALLVFSVCLSAQAEWYKDEQAIMGTAVSVNLWHDDADQAHQAIAAVMTEMRRIDASLSPYKTDSELSQVNARAGATPITISEELTQLIDKALYFSRVSSGAFDITFASVGFHYDYRKHQQPSDADRNRLLPAINYRFIALDRVKRTLHFTHPDVKIDLGGIAKGYAVDRGAAILLERGVAHATISAGGDSRIIGDKRGEPWIIGIKKPRGLDPTSQAERDQVAIMLPLDNIAISTSGDYERFFIDGDTGERIHHILNPQTGKSAGGIVSASVIGPQGFDTDPLSTTVFVLGVEKGLRLINQLPGFDCIIIDSAGMVHYSTGLTPPVKS